MLLDTVTYRFSGHSPSDASSFRERAEVEAWQQVDPLLTFASGPLNAKVCAPEDLERLRSNVAELIFRCFRKAVDLKISPRSSQKETGCLIERVMFSNGRVESFDPSRKPDVLTPKEENPRVNQLAQRSRSAFDAQGKQLPRSKCIGIRDAIFEAILHRFYIDPTLVAYGEENRDWGGAFAVYRGLTEALPYHRLFNSPISEGAIVGSAVGYALEGGRVLAELMYCDFLGRAGDEVFNQLSKWQAMSGGAPSAPIFPD